MFAARRARSCRRPLVGADEVAAREDCRQRGEQDERAHDRGLPQHPSHPLSVVEGREDDMTLCCLGTVAGNEISFPLLTRRLLTVDDA